MIAKVAKKHMYKCVALLVCLLIAGNSVHGAVLCFGADGHVEIESTFHEQCSAPAHAQRTEQEQLACQIEHAENGHCVPCEDVPISIGLAKITRTPKQLIPAFSALAVTVTAPADRFNFLAYHSASTALGTAYFVPPSSVVLLI
jgi:hypothetical protein